MNHKQQIQLAYFLSIINDVDCKLYEKNHMLRCPY